MNGSLFPAEVLAAARARYEQAHPAQPRVKPGEASSQKVNKSTPCGGCGHAKRNHCDPPMPHMPSDDAVGWHDCIVSHCLSGTFRDGNWYPCACNAFQNPYNGTITPWKPTLLGTTPCAKCNHPKNHHCRKGMGSIQVDGTPFVCRHYQQWLQLNVSSGKVQPECTSTACAELVGPAVGPVEQQELCSCTRFVSPYTARRKAAKTAAMKRKSKKSSAVEMQQPEIFPSSAAAEADQNLKGGIAMGTLIPEEELQAARERYLREQARIQAERQSQQPKTRAEILVEVCREDPTLTVAELAEAAERSHSWVQRTLKAAGLKAATPCRRRQSSAVTAPPPAVPPAPLLAQKERTMSEMPEAEWEELRIQEVLDVLDQREQIAHYVPNCRYFSNLVDDVADQLEIFERAKVDYDRRRDCSSLELDFEHLRDFPSPDVCIRIAPEVSNHKARVLMLKLIEGLDEFRKPLVPPEKFATWSWNSTSPAAPPPPPPAAPAAAPPPPPPADAEVEAWIAKHDHRRLAE